MGKLIKKRIEGMSWWVKASLVLLLTVATTVFMYEGWYKPRDTQAAPTLNGTWSNVYAATATTISVDVTSSAYTAPAGSNRMLLVAVNYEIGTNNATLTSQTVTFGGVTVQPIATTGGALNRSHSWLGYILNANIPAGSNTVRVQSTASVNTISGVQIAIATYNGVAQSAPTNFVQVANATAAVTFPSTLAYPSDSIAVLTCTNGGTPATSTWTTVGGSAFAEETGATSTAGAFTAFVFDTGTNATAGSYTTGTTTTFGGTTSLRSAMVAVSLAPYVVTDSTPPTAGTVTVNPDIASNFTSSAPTITTQFTDAESAITCEYTTNGTTWTAGTVSGTGPTYTCTANPSGLSGTLTINMRATSSGGGPTTASSITRTVDTSVPTDGTLTVTPGNLQNSLSWTTATDAGSGISSYILRYATGATPPASCAVGTAVPGSPFSSATLSTTHTGLINGTQYSYRICATDNIGNTSGGATGSGTPTAVVSTIESCGACHGYKTTFNDGSGRNNPVGQFQGSHNKHVIGASIDCAVCHVAPATETSADYGHSRGTITMQSPLSGGSYSRISPIAISNTFSPGSCSGTSCHAQVYSTASGTSPNWGTPGGGCGACHTGTPGAFQGNGAPNTGGHNIHMTAGASCNNCHAGAVSAVTGGSRHGNGFINLTTGYNSPTRNQATKRAAGGTYYTCSAASCHADPYSSGYVATNVWSPTSAGCVACHKNAANNSNLAAFTGYSAASTQLGPKTGSHSAHMDWKPIVCADCHTGAVSSVSGGSNHGNAVVNVIQYGATTPAKHAQPFTYTVNGCAAACHITATWGAALGCIDCHASPITRKYGRPGTTLAAVTTEFGLAWGHKRGAASTLGARLAVTSNDCIVCHLEGNGTSLKTSRYHANGNIDLRDPDVEGETPITNISGGAFTFQRFSTSYAAATRTTTGHTSNTDIANVVSQKFCLKCHDANGAGNTKARTAVGSQYMPWGGTQGANYTVANGAAAANGLVNVDAQFATTNSSVHPIKGPRNKGFPTPARYNPPYNNFTRAGGATAAAAVKTDGVVMNCFDCHNVVGTPLTRRTVAAHGNAVTLRGIPFISGTPAAGTNEATLCKVCHAGYDTNTGASHGASPTTALTNINRTEKVPFTRWGCNVCHSSGYNTAAVRPVRAMDVHGVNALPATGQTLSGNWLATGKPYAFIRNRSYLGNHSPALIGGVAANTPSACNMIGTDGGTVCNNQGSKTYTLGGSY